MKKIFTLLVLSIVLAAAAGGAHARCNTHAIILLASGASVSKAPLLVLEFRMESRKYVEGLNGKYPVYLKGFSDIVPLKVEEVLPGGLLRTQVLFKPASTLKEGVSYELVIENLPKYEKPKYLNPKKGQWEKIVLTAGAAAPAPDLEWMTAPVETGRTVVALGCGPERYVDYSLGTPHARAAYVRVRLTNRATGAITEQVLAVEKGAFQVGRDMCSGNFDFRDETRFEIAFALVDREGNRSAFTAPQELVAPTG